MVEEQPPPGAGSDPIDELRERFRTAWRSGQTPRIEDYLPLAPRSEQERLFQELFFAEVRFRQTRGETPALEEYVRRFPDRADWLSTRTVLEPVPPTRPTF